MAFYSQILIVKIRKCLINNNNSHIMYRWSWTCRLLSSRSTNVSGRHQQKLTTFRKTFIITLTLRIMSIASVELPPLLHACSVSEARAENMKLLPWNFRAKMSHRASGEFDGKIQLKNFFRQFPSEASKRASITNSENCCSLVSRLVFRSKCFVTRGSHNASVSLFIFAFQPLQCVDCDLHSI